MLAQIEVLDGLRSHTRPGTAEPTLRLLAQYAEFAGWLHQDSGDTAAAMFWSDRATQWAQAIGDYQMVAYMLVRKSNIALLDDDAVNVVELAAAARKVPGPASPKLHALAAQQEARGWALAGEADEFQHRLDTAANLLRDHPDDVDETAPLYLHHYDLDTLEEQSASGYRACGKAETAIAILEAKIAATPKHLHRAAWVSVSSVSTANRRDSTAGRGSIRYSIETLSARDNRASSTPSRRRLPASILASVVRSSPTLSASSCCDMPADRRTCRTCSPIRLQSCCPAIVR